MPGWCVCENVCVRVCDCTFCVCISRPALPADNVHTIQLPVAGCSIPEGTMCKMYGWGETKGTSVSASVCLSQVFQVQRVDPVLVLQLPFNLPPATLVLSFQNMMEQQSEASLL